MTHLHEALRDLLTTRGQDLKRYAYVLCGNDDDADDLVQGALVKVLSRPVRQPDSLEAFLKRVLVNEYLDRYRARRTWQRYLPRLAALDTEPDPAAGVAGHEDVRKALFELSPRQRACVVLRYYDDLTVPEVARTLRCSEGAVKRYVSDAFSRLRPLLGEITADPQKEVPWNRRTR